MDMKAFRAEKNYGTFDIYLKLFVDKNPKKSDFSTSAAECLIFIEICS